MPKENIIRMAPPSVRVRVTEVRLEDECIDPFWLLVSVEELPYILDVGLTVIRTCNSFLASESQLPLISSCQLWLDGCRLPDAESTQILRDNDSIVASISKQGLQEESASSSECHKRKKVLVESVSRKRKRSLENDSSSEIIKEKKKGKDDRKQKGKMKNVGDHGSIASEGLKETGAHFVKMDNACISSDTSGLEDCLMSVDHKSPTSDLRLEFEDQTDNTPPLKKKKKRKNKEKESSNDNITPAVACEIDGNSVQSDVGLNNSSTHFPDVSEIEEQKRKLLGKLDTFAQSRKLPEATDNAGVELNVSQSDKDDKNDSLRKRRRRRKKKSKREVETKTVIRVEDKPRSSVLNLPCDMQPQNCKITFDSDTEDAFQKNTIDDEVEPNGNDEDDRKMDVDEEDTKDLKVKINDCHEDVKKSNENSLESQAKSTSKRYKDLTPTCRKYLMRSTVGILDSLRSNSDPATNLSSIDNTPITGNRFEEPSSRSSIKKKSVVPPIVAGESSVKLRNNNAAVKSNSDFIGESESLTGGHSYQASNVNPEGKLHQHQPKAASSPDCDLDKTNAPTSAHSVDYEAKFIELLQRKKLSSTSCSVSRSENGVTVCTRNKSPRVQLKSFANPATDVLTNVSTIKKFSGDDNLSPLKSATGGKFGVKVTVNKNGVDTMSSGKVEVIPLDVDNCPKFSGDPCKGDILAYKVLEMTADYTPVVSDFKTGKVLSSDGGFLTLELFGTPAPKNPKGKFELVYDEEEETTGNSLSDEQVHVEFASMMDTRLVQRYSDIKER